MKIKLFILLSLSNEAFAFMSPTDIMDRMTLQNAKKVMLMPLHPQEKIKQGLRLMEESAHFMEYEITRLSKKSARTIPHTKSKL